MPYLGIDSGTQSTKSIVLDLGSGEILTTAQRSYDLVPDLPPGHMEQERQEWIDATEATILECKKADRAMNAIFKMKKLDIKRLKQAYAGRT